MVLYPRPCLLVNHVCLCVHVAPVLHVLLPEAVALQTSYCITTLHLTALTVMLHLHRCLCVPVSPPLRWIAAWLALRDLRLTLPAYGCSVKAQRGARSRRMPLDHRTLVAMDTHAVPGRWRGWRGRQRDKADVHIHSRVGNKNTS